MTDSNVTPSASESPPASQLTQPPAAAGTPSRLAWLDLLRGIAALFVVFDHLSYYLLQHVRAEVYNWFDAGNYGVFVFFIISGYIVPASLERKGSLRTFWLGRLFRLLPLFGLVIAAALLLHAVGLTGPRGLSKNAAAAVLAHLFMLNDLLGENNLLVVIWTLSYEMVFYLLITALFTVGAHKRSGRIALPVAGEFPAEIGVREHGLLLMRRLSPRAWCLDGAAIVV